MLLAKPKIHRKKKLLNVIFICITDWVHVISCRITSVCHDDISRFVKLLAKPGKNWLEPEDLVDLVQVGVLFPLYSQLHVGLCLTKEYSLVSH